MEGYPNVYCLGYSTQDDPQNTWNCSSSAYYITSTPTGTVGGGTIYPAPWRCPAPLAPAQCVSTARAPRREVRGWTGCRHGGAGLRCVTAGRAADSRARRRSPSPASGQCERRGRYQKWPSLPGFSFGVAVPAGTGRPRPRGAMPSGVAVKSCFRPWVARSAAPLGSTVWPGCVLVTP